MPTAKTIIDVVTNNLTRGCANNKAEESAVERCVKLLEHAGECRAQGVCDGGPHCYRACRVLLHQRACSTEHCPVCRQLEPLCHLHARRCQKKDKSCNLPFCPNGKELLHVVRSTVNVSRNRRSEAPAECVPVECGRSLPTQVTPADLLKCLSAGGKRGVRGVSRLPHDNLSVTSLPRHLSGLKRHAFSDANSCCHMQASNMAQVQASISSWKATVSIVPFK